MISPFTHIFFSFTICKNLLGWDMPSLEMLAGPHCSVGIKVQSEMILFFNGLALKFNILNLLMQMNSPNLLWAFTHPCLVKPSSSSLYLGMQKSLVRVTDLAKTHDGWYRGVIWWGLESPWKQTLGISERDFWSHPNCGCCPGLGWVLSTSFSLVSRASAVTSPSWHWAVSQRKPSSL